MTTVDYANKFTGHVPQIGKLHTYDPKRGDLSRPDQSNCPPEQALILPLCFTTINGQGVVVFEWIIEDPECPGVELQVDYCVPEAIYPASDYHRKSKHGEVFGKHETARHNFARWVEQQPFGGQEPEHEPRSAAGILMDCVDLLGERGKQYDKTGQERSAARIAAVYNALKGASLTAMDIWDLLMILKLVRAQDATAPDSRIDLTSYAALSAEEMESICYGSGPSEVESPTQTKGVNVAGWSHEAVGRIVADLKQNQQKPEEVLMQVLGRGTRINGVIGDDLGKHIKINLFGDI
ncbi:MAG: hypothetical protein [Bacteriophage sp.]|nr:MAG: hypothetical protein [Bacteriophage sp.]